MQRCDGTLSVLKETLTSQSVQSDKVHECSEAQKCLTKSDDERLLIHHISSANMAQRDAVHANVVSVLTRRVGSRAAAPARAVPMLPGHVRLLFRRAVQADVRGERAADH